jgi:Raf kinase inhibitor-like YbhB/YbcL family protein
MKTKTGIVIVMGSVVVALFATLGIVLWRNTHLPGETIVNTLRHSTTQTPMTMTLRSSAFEQNQLLPTEYTCDGTGVNPPLEFLGVPDGTKSLALILEDPDVPKTIREDGLWYHWLAWNMPATTAGVGVGEELHGSMGLNTSGTVDYSAPCPPDREHRYIFRLYALDKTLGLAAGATYADLHSAMKGHILEEAELMSVYNRQ